MVDLSGIEHYIPNVAAMLGIEPATALLLVTVIVVIANLISKFIPDDKTGVLGAIRKVAKFVGIAASNRIMAGLTVNEVVRATVPMVDQLDNVQEQMESKLEGFGEIVQAFPGASNLPERGSDGKFVKKGKE